MLAIKRPLHLLVSHHSYYNVISYKQLLLTMKVADLVTVSKSMYYVKLKHAMEC